MQQDTWVVIPVYNEAPVIGSVVKELAKYFGNIICVNDGSSDATLEEIKKTPAHLVTHFRNQGAGAALKTGLEYALAQPGAQYFVTFDADGQHDSADASKMVRHIRENQFLDVVLGSRFLGTAINISWFKKRFLLVARAFSNLTTGIKLTDVHNGLRVFNRRSAEAMDLQCSGMAHASEIMYKINEENLAYTELPITITYTKYSKTKGQSMLNAFGIVGELLSYRIKARRSSAPVRRLN